MVQFRSYNSKVVNLETHPLNLREYLLWCMTFFLSWNDFVLQEYSMLCILCGRGADTVSIKPKDPRKGTEMYSLYWTNDWRLPSICQQIYWLWRLPSYIYLLWGSFSLTLRGKNIGGEIACMADLQHSSWGL